MITMVSTTPCEHTWPLPVRQPEPPGAAIDCTGSVGTIPSSGHTAKLLLFPSSADQLTM